MFLKKMQQLDKIKVSQDQKNNIFDKVTTKKEKRLRPMFFLKVAMSFALILVASTTIFKKSPQKDTGLIISAVAMETDASLIFNLNSDNNVVNVEVVSEDGFMADQLVNVEGMHIQHAMTQVLESPAYQEHMQGTLLEVSVYSDDKDVENELATQVSDIVYSRIKQENCHIQQVSKDTFVEAKRHHMGVNKYRKIQSIIESGGTYTLDDLKQCSQNELNQIEKDCGNRGHGHGKGCE